MARHRIGLSAAWESTGGSGQPRWLRRFGRPGGLGPSERVFLVAETTAADSRLILNGTPLADPSAGARRSGSATRSEWDVTPLLQDRNELVLIPAAAFGTGGEAAVRRRSLPPPLGTVSIEIGSAEIDSIA